MTEDRPPVPQSLQPLVAEMVVDLSRRLEVAESDIAVDTVQAVTWRDGSLGCPQPGMAYTQALVSGYRVLLVAGGQTYPYHTRGTSRFVRCDEKRAQPPLNVE